jgi:hypothetical protein
MLFTLSGYADGMNSGTIITLVIVAVIVVAALGVVFQKLGQKKRSERLQERFGPEYDRAVHGKDDRKAAESELLEREKRHKKLELRTLDAGQRRDYEQRWTRVQADFVDDPRRAVRDADRLVVDVMSARGYPVDDFDQRADDLSVDYPVVTENYRTARTVARSNERGEATTEDLRTAVTSYRSLVDALLLDKESRGDRSSADQARGHDGERDSGERSSAAQDTGADSGSHRADRTDHADRENDADHADHKDTGRNGHRASDQRSTRAMDSSGQEGSS